MIVKGYIRLHSADWLANIRLGWKWQAASNALSYNSVLLTTTVKRFYSTGLMTEGLNHKFNLRVSVIKLFTVVTFTLLPIVKIITVVINKVV
jgi:hypothetical protein